MGLKQYLKRGIAYIMNGVPEYHTTVEIKTSTPSELLKDRNILITGGSRGLGYYFAKKSVEEGANVIITGRNETRLKEIAAKLGDNAGYIVFDVRDVKEMQSLFDQAQRMLGNRKIDSLISNAGVSLHEGNFRNVSEENWDLQIDTNLKGNYFIVKEYVKYLEQQEDKTGNIIVVTSERAMRPDDIPYGLTKNATNSFVKAISQKVIEEGIRINAVGPGVTATDMTGYSRDGNMYAQWQSGKRIFMPEEVAEVVNFLLSDLSACISGEVITCDQGRYITHW